MKNIIVTGGAGYIGAHIVDELCESGYKVLVVDNLSSGYKENLNPKSKFINCDIKSKDDLENVFLNHDIDAIVHMAAYKSVSESMIKTTEYTENNLIGSLNLISNAIQYSGNKKNVYIFVDNGDKKNCESSRVS